MFEKGQLNLDLNTSSVQNAGLSEKEWSDYTTEEKARFQESIREARKTGRPLRPEEVAFIKADEEFFRPDDQVRYSNGGSH